LVKTTTIISPATCRSQAPDQSAAFESIINRLQNPVANGQDQGGIQWSARAEHWRQ
jgi:hypothetical protein